MGDPLDLGFRIADGIEADALARRRRLDAARLAEIRVAVELAKDDEIQALYHLGLQGRGPDQLREHVGGPEIREQLHLLAQLEKAVAGPLLARQALLPGPAGGAEEDRVGTTRERKRLVRKGHAARLDPCEPYGRLLGLGIGQHMAQHLDGLSRYLRADAVAG